VLQFPEDFLEAQWSLWQSVPYLGSIHVPVQFNNGASFLKQKKFTAVNYMGLHHWADIKDDCKPRFSSNEGENVRFCTDDSIIPSIPRAFSYDALQSVLSPCRLHLHITKTCVC
jgi:hypothetical protein